MYTILITGGAGFIGSILTNMLVKKGYNVIVLDTLYKNGDSLLPLVSFNNFEFIRGDITNRKQLEDINKKHKPDFVINLAAIVGLGACNDMPGLAEKVNIEGCKNVLESFPASIIIQSSTGSVYGKVKENLCTEDLDCKPLSIYGITKYEGEKFLHNKNNCIIYRFATAMGVSPQHRLNLMPNQLVYEAITNKHIVVYEPDNMRTFISTQDMALSFLHAIENHKTMCGQIYNIGHESLNLSKRQLVEKIQSLTGCGVTYVDTFKDLDARDYIVDYTKINQTGFKLSYGIDTVIKQLIKATSLLTQDKRYG